MQVNVWLRSCPLIFRRVNNLLSDGLNNLGPRVACCSISAQGLPDGLNSLGLESAQGPVSDAPGSKKVKLATGLPNGLVEARLYSQPKEFRCRGLSDGLNSQGLTVDCGS